MFGRHNDHVGKLILNLDEQLKDTAKQLKEFREKYFNLAADIRKLERENALLKKMFDDSDNTQVINFNGKLFKITDISYFTSEDDADTLSVYAICVTMEGD